MLLDQLPEAEEHGKLGTRWVMVEPAAPASGPAAAGAGRHCALTLPPQPT